MWRIFVWARRCFLFFWSQKAGLLLYLREQSCSDKLALAGGSVQPRRCPCLPRLPGRSAPLRQQLLPPPERRDIASAARACRAGTRRDVPGREAQFFSSSAFFLLKTLLGSSARLRPASQALRSRGALGAPGRAFRRPGAASFEPLLFVAGLSWPAKGERGKAAASCRALVGRAGCPRPRAAAVAGPPGGAPCSGWAFPPGCGTRPRGSRGAAAEQRWCRG